MNMLNIPKNCTTELPSYCFITLTKIEVQNFGLRLSEILRMFVKTLTAHDKYSLRNRKNLCQSIQLQLSKKQKICAQFFAAYLRFTSNVEHFVKKDDSHRLCIFEIRDCERGD